MDARATHSLKVGGEYGEAVEIAMYGQGGEGFVRMNIGCPRKIVKEALERMVQALDIR